MARSPDILRATFLSLPSHQNTVESVLGSGLLSGRELRARGIAYVGSFDNPPKDTVWGNIVRPGVDTLDDNLRKAFYDEHNAVFPALAERLGQTRDEYGKMGAEHFSSVVCSSFLVICRLSDMSDVRKGEDETGLITPVVPKEWFYMVVFPEEVAKGIQVPSVNFNAVSVGYTSQRINGFFGNLQVVLPNYEAVVKRVIAQTSEDLWVSGVRLSTSKLI